MHIVYLSHTGGSFHGLPLVVSWPLLIGGCYGFLRLVRDIGSLVLDLLEPANRSAPAGD